MAKDSRARGMEQVIRTYIKACNDGDAEGIAACFSPEAVHYFPWAPGWAGGDAIGSGFAKVIHDQGGYWTVDQLIIDVEQNAAVLEWSRFFRQRDRILRGAEWYVFDSETLRIREIRPYIAGSPSREVARQELMGFDYAGRGYPTLS